MSNKKTQPTQKTTAPVVENQFPTEEIDLASGGKCYPSDHPLASGKCEIKYMTTKEEDILTSQNLIKKGLVIDRLLESLIITPGVSIDDLLLGDKNCLLVAARILAYGPEYKVTVSHPRSQETLEHTFNLSECEYKELPEDVDYSENKFEYELPITKRKIGFSLLTGKQEVEISKSLKAMKSKLGRESEVTTRLKEIITSVDGETNKLQINNFVDNMLARESISFRKYIETITPDINMTQEIDWEGETISIGIPMDVEFFWPKSIG